MAFDFQVTEDAALPTKTGSSKRDANIDGAATASVGKVVKVTVTEEQARGLRRALTAAATALKLGVLTTKYDKDAGVLSFITDPNGTPRPPRGPRKPKADKPVADAKPAKG